MKKIKLIIYCEEDQTVFVDGNQEMFFDQADEQPEYIVDFLMESLGFESIYIKRIYQDKDEEIWQPIIWTDSLSYNGYGEGQWISLEEIVDPKIKENLILNQASPYSEKDTEENIVYCYHCGKDSPEEDHENNCVDL